MFVETIFFQTCRDFLRLCISNKFKFKTLAILEYACYREVKLTKSYEDMMTCVETLKEIRKSFCLFIRGDIHKSGDKR